MDNINLKLNYTKMNKNQTIEYQTPVVSIQRMEQSGILCASGSFGVATTDNFVVGDDITDKF